MKKFCIFLLSALLMLSVTTARAENSAVSMSGKLMEESWVWVNCTNVTGRGVSAGMVAVLATSSIVNATGTYATLADSLAAPMTLGVWMDDVSTGKVGRVLVRGPIQVLVGVGAGTSSPYYPAPGQAVVASGGGFADTASIGRVVAASKTAITAGSSSHFMNRAVGYRFGSAVEGTNGFSPGTGYANDKIWIWVDPGTIDLYKAAQ